MIDGGDRPAGRGDAAGSEAEPEVGSARAARVAVVGGGFTGLVAGYRLAGAGVRVALLERSAVVGGLVAGFTVCGGAHLEKAYHFVYPTDRHLLGLLDELGLQQELSFHRSTIATCVAGRFYPLTTPGDLLRFTPLPLRDRLRTGAVALRLRTLRNWRKLGGVTAMQWLERWNGRRATRVLWEPLLRGKFDRYYDQIAMAWLWGRIKVRQESSTRRGERLGYFRDGWHVIPEALAARMVAHGAEVRTGVTIERIAASATAGRPAVELVVDGQAEAFDGVVATVPGPVLARLTAEEPAMTEEYRSRLLGVEYLSAVVMVFTTRQQLSTLYWHQISDRDAPFLVLLDLTNLTGDTARFGGRHVYYVGDYVTAGDDLLRAPDTVVRDRWLAGVGRLFPRFEPASVEECHVFRLADAQHVVTPGYESSIPASRTPLPGLYLANFAQIYPEDRGTNYAVRDGERVAAMVLEDLRAGTNRRRASSEA